MKISSTRTETGGFTTVELVVVLAIVVIMGSVAMVSMGPALRDAGMRSACRTVISALNYARSHAVTHQVVTRMVVENGDTVFVEAQVDEERVESVTTFAEKRRRLPSGVSITGITKAGVSDEENWVEFTALGRAEEAVIELNGSGDRRYLVVDPITGRCRIESGEDSEDHRAPGE